MLHVICSTILVAFGKKRVEKKCSKEEPSNSFLEVKIFMEVKTFFPKKKKFLQKFMKFPKMAFGIVLLVICDPNMIAK